MSRLSIGVVIGALFAANAAAADVADLKGDYNAEAFGDVDDDWLRLTANRITECGAFGKNGTRRVDLLVKQYLKIGDAIEAGNDASALQAARSLSSSIEANARFEKCWSQISRKEGVARQFTNMIAQL